MNRYSVLGIMSGTSLDGLDLALCQFTSENGLYQFELLKAETVPYSDKWINELSNAANLTGKSLLELHNRYGNYIGFESKRFIESSQVKPQYISIHGHTVFHEPENRFTYQLGNGAITALSSGVDTVANFREMDMALGGQGAPLVPIGDLYLFAKYPFCLNLGGIANISHKKGDGSIIGFDICGCNIVLNRLAQKASKKMDRDGQMAFKGVLDRSLLEKLISVNRDLNTDNNSLSKESVLETGWPVLKQSGLSIHDQLTTYCHFISHQIETIVQKCLDTDPKLLKPRILVTGGGAYNKYLINCLSMSNNLEIIIPANSIVEFKEALIFAFLAVRKLENRPNCLASVTGASRDCVSGIIYNAINP